MADRYWVGGTASWDATAGTKWATTSGGAGGAAVPTSADDVFFDAASGAITCTINSNFQPCRSLNFTGFTGTISSSAFGVNIFQNLVLSSSMTITGAAFNWQMVGTTTGLTVTTNGKTLTGNLTFSGIGGVWTLADALTVSGSLTVTQGTFTTNNYNVTADSLASSNTNVRTINLGSSTVTLTSSSFAWATGNPLNLTLNAGTSTLVMTAASAAFDIATLTLTFNNLSFTSTAAGTHNLPQSVDGTVFNNITIAGIAVAGVRIVQIPGRQTINGTLSTTGTAGNRRVWLRSSTYGVARTLTINSAPSLTDADFRDIYVIGTAAPISGTRIGDLRGTRGITASTPKTVYWNLAGAQNWSATGWATTPTGTPSDDNFPLAQDTATFTDAGSVTGTITMNALVPYTGTVDMSGRTSAMTIFVNDFTIYENWKFGSGVTQTAISSTLTFSGRKTQTITSAGKTFAAIGITIDSYGGSVELADALSIPNTLTVTNGTFDTKNYNVTAGTLSSNNSNVRTISLGSSTVTLTAVSSVAFTTATNLTLNAGTSQITISASAPTFAGGTGLTFYNVTFSAIGVGGTATFTGTSVFNNVSVTSNASAGLISLTFLNNQTITGTLTVAGATAVRRIFLQSNTLGTARTLTVGTLAATDCDFRDITLAGAAAGSSPTRAGDCGGNTSITFPAAKTVYWNLAGAQNWSATAWCPSSGGTPDINQFPLAQDTAVFDNTGSVTGNILIEASWNIGEINSSTRSSAMTLTASATCTVYGSITTGSGITYSLTTVIFSGRGTQTLTTNGRTFSGLITVNSATGTLQLGDALTTSSNLTFTLTSGTFDAVSYNVTIGLFSSSSNVAAGQIKSLKMGSGTWTLSGTGTVWNVDSSTFSTGVFSKGTANIVLSDTSATARTFTASSASSYNKLTIGGATGTSTTTINGTSGVQFTEIASTKTVAHTLALGAGGFTFGAWTVSGTVGNVVTLTGTATVAIAGARVSGVDYLALGTTTISAPSPGEFYAGANSTGGTNAILTAAPAATTRYWVGGTGTWDATTTTNWSTTSGGVSGASVPTSVDNVIFDTASSTANAAYTVTIGTNAFVRFADLTMNGPGGGNTVTWTAGLGSPQMIAHGNFNLAGGTAGITRIYNGGITLTGSTTGKTLTTNGVSLASGTTVNGVGCGWTLGSALNIGSSTLTVTNGSFSLATYNFTAGTINTNSAHTITINLGSSTVSLSSSAPIGFGSTETQRANFTFTASTSQINFTSLTSVTINGNNNTFYNASATTADFTTFTINGVNTFNNLTTAGRTSSGVSVVSFGANQTINGTLTLSAGTNATMRQFLQSNTIGTTRTLTCAAFSGTDADFRDITIAGAAAPVSGTRLGDCKGNSGITFPAAKTVYWVFATSASNWETNVGGIGGWSDSIGGTRNLIYFPLAQDTAVFPSSGFISGGALTLGAAYNIGTIDMSARTSNTMTLATGTTAPFIYGNWINGTGTTLSGTGIVTFAGRGSQTITSAGKTFTQPVNLNTPGGTVTLQDAFNCSSTSNLTWSTGTFNANIYNVSIAGFLQLTSTTLKTVGIGSGTWTFTNVSSAVWNVSTGLLAVTGTGTISCTGATAKTFDGGGISYSGITLDQGGAGTLTINNNNTFKNITNSYSATGAATINIGIGTQTVTQFTGTGTVGKVLTIQGTSASSPGTLILTSGTVTTPDYLAITGVRAYNLSSTWFAGANSTNNGSLGWIFSAGVIPPVLSSGNFFFVF